MNKTRIGITAYFVFAAATFAVPHSAPAWLRYTAAGILVLPAIALLGVLVLAGIQIARDARRPKATVAHLPAAPIEEEQVSFVRMYDIVRRIHGDDIAERLTDDEIEAEYERYDRAETAASEDRCQACDPEHAPATCLVEAWDERRGDDHYIGEWLLCSTHAEAKVAAMEATGASTCVDDWSTEEPVVGGDIR